MSQPTPQSLYNAALYGGASALLVLDALFLAKALIVGNYVPILPILVGILLAAGLLAILYAQQHERILDRREHRRLSRVATQLEAPLVSLREDFHALIKKSEKLPADVRMNIKRMETRTNVLLENIRDVFLMMRAETGPIMQDARVYDVCSLVEEVVAKAQPLARARNVELLSKAHCTDARVRLDKRLFGIALMHLLENGIMYTLTPGMVNVAILKGPSYVRVVVQDRGVGVKEKDKPAILLPYARGDKASQFDPDGIGVGLTLVNLITKELGGVFAYRPRKNNSGSEFEIKLPLAK